MIKQTLPFRSCFLIVQEVKVAFWVHLILLVHSPSLPNFFFFNFNNMTTVEICCCHVKVYDFDYFVVVKENVDHSNYFERDVKFHQW